MNTGTVKLKTERLLLRKIRLTDYFYFRKWYRKPAVNTFSQGKAVNSEYDTLFFIARHFFNYYFKRRRSYYYWAAVLDGKMIGFVGFINGKSGALSLYYMTSPEYWNEGYTGEAVKAVTEYIKTQSVGSVNAACDSANEASYKLLLNNGFNVVRTIENGCRYPDGRSGDRVIFHLE